MNAPPEFLGVLARALLKAPNHKLALLPAGEASIEEAGKASVASGKGDLTQYRITGLGFSPQSIWLDQDGNAASSIDLVLGGAGSIRSGSGAIANGSAENRRRSGQSASLTNLPTRRKATSSSVTPASSIRAT